MAKLFFNEWDNFETVAFMVRPWTCLDVTWLLTTSKMFKGLRPVLEGFVVTIDARGRVMYTGDVQSPSISIRMLFKWYYYILKPFNDAGRVMWFLTECEHSKLQMMFTFFQERYIHEDW